jgi:hypothetical protein
MGNFGSEEQLMTAQLVSSSRSAFSGRVPSVCTALVAAVAMSAAANSALAVPFTFTNVDASSSNQSKIGIVATATFTGATLTEGPQFAPGGLNGNGSEVSLYKQTATNTPSNMLANLGLSSILFPGGGTAQAANGAGLLGNYAVAPGVGGSSGTAPADYGVLFSSPQSTVIPPIDLSGLGVSGLGTLNLGTLTGINLNIALRNFSVDMQSAALALTPGGAAYPSRFDSTQVNVGVSGTADISLTASLKQDNLTDFLITNAALLLLQSTLSGQGVSIVLSNQNFITDTEQLGIGFTAPLPVTFSPNADASQGTIDHVGSNLRLTMPLAFNVTPTIPAGLSSFVSANFAMSGQLIGQTPFVVVPEPSSFALAGLGVVVLGCASWRKKHRRA